MLSEFNPHHKFKWNIRMEVQLDSLGLHKSQLVLGSHSEIVLVYERRVCNMDVVRFLVRSEPLELIEQPEVRSLGQHFQARSINSCSGGLEVSPEVFGVLRTGM
jgi:hypothetical protein